MHGAFFNIAARILSDMLLITASNIFALYFDIIDISFFADFITCFYIFPLAVNDGHDTLRHTINLFFCGIVFSIYVII